MGRIAGSTNRKILVTDLDNAVTTALKLIETNYIDFLTTEKVANMCGLPKVVFGKYFRETQGMTFREKVADKRIAVAVELLLAGVKIEAIAVNVGYLSKKNFFREFRAIHAMTPKEYRESVERRLDRQPADL